MVASTSLLWVMTHPGIARDRTVIEALFYLQYASGSPRSAVGAARRMATNDPDHRIMLLLISSGLFLLFLGRQGSLSSTWRART
jgi:hypothetical protein